MSIFRNLKISISKNKENLMFISFFTLLVFVIYSNFILGNKFLISKHMAMDSFDQLYPDLLSKARMIENGLFMPMIDFSRGVGLAVFSMIPRLENLPAYFGEDNVAYLMGLFLAVKVILSGLFFYNYLKIKGTSSYFSSIFAISFALCGHLLYRQFWKVYPNEILLIAIWLYAFERMFIKKDIRLLPFATFLLFYNISSSPYYVVLYSMITSVYAIYRLHCYGKNVGFEIKHAIKFFVFHCVFIILSCGFFSIIESVMNIFASERLQTGISTYTSDGASSSFITDPIALISGFFRSFGANINGIKDDFFGANSYLGDLSLYCGLFTLLLVPSLVIAAKGREKKWFILGTVIVFAYLMITPLRTLANGFSSDLFKLSSFWIILLFLIIVTSNIDTFFKCLDNKKKLGIIVTGSVYCVLALILTAVYSNEIRIYSMLLSVLLMISYTALCVLMRADNRFTIKKLLISLVVFEVGYMAYTCANQMDAMTKETLEQRVYYNDYTNEALSKLYEEDSIRSYRIDKQYFSYRFNDGTAQDYYGTSHYIGGVGVGNQVLEFYESMKLPTTASGYIIAYGTSSYDYINEILGVKYLLSLNRDIKNYGYSYQYSVDKVNVFKNEKFLPFGYGYDKYIKRSDFEGKSNYEKQKILMEACVIEDDNISIMQELHDKEIAEQAIIEVENYDKYKVDFEIEDNSVIRLIDNNPDNVVVVKTSFDLENTEYRARLMVNEEQANWIRIDNKESYVFELNYNDLSSFKFIDIKNSNIELKNIECFSIPETVYYKSYNENVDKIRGNGYAITDFSGNFIKGDIELQEDGIFYIPIPYSPNWNVFVDGNKQETFITNIGYIGTFLENGKHEIVLEYSNNKIVLDAFISLILLLSTILWATNKKLRNIIGNFIEKVSGKILRGKQNV